MEDRCRTPERSFPFILCSSSQATYLNPAASVLWVLAAVTSSLTCARPAYGADSGDAMCSHMPAHNVHLYSGAFITYVGGDQSKRQTEVEDVIIAILWEM